MSTLKKVVKSKIAAWCCLILIVLIIILTFKFRVEWWEFIDLFFAFMMVFSHLASLYLRKLIGRAADTLDKCAVVFGICFLISWIAEYILMNNL